MSKSLCYYAFDSLVAALDRDYTSISLARWMEQSPSSVQSPSPLFVTWTSDSKLRGCIGIFAPQPLELGVKRFAITAALNDTRYSPVTSKELKAGFEVSVTLLAQFSRIDSCLDWELGVHGLQIVIGEEFLGTFLPSVAVEQGWDQTETLYHLLKKAEFPGITRSKTIDFYNQRMALGFIRLETYTGQKELASYDEYIRAKRAL